LISRRLLLFFELTIAAADAGGHKHVAMHAVAVMPVSRHLAVLMAVPWFEHELWFSWLLYSVETHRFFAPVMIAWFLPPALLPPPRAQSNAPGPALFQGRMRAVPLAP
jgi:hypothetical protein